MSTIPKPPIRCPHCRAQLGALAKRWIEVGPSQRSLRVPAEIDATYLCGARIVARFIVRAAIAGTLSPRGNSAHWEMDAAAGCPVSLGRDLTQQRQSRRF